MKVQTFKTILVIISVIALIFMIYAVHINQDFYPIIRLIGVPIWSIQFLSLFVRDSN